MFIVFPIHMVMLYPFQTGNLNGDLGAIHQGMPHFQSHTFRFSCFISFNKAERVLSSCNCSGFSWLFQCWNQYLSSLGSWMIHSLVLNFCGSKFFCKGISLHRTPSLSWAAYCMVSYAIALVSYMCFFPKRWTLNLWILEFLSKWPHSADLDQIL